MRAISWPTSSTKTEISTSTAISLTASGYFEGNLYSCSSETSSLRMEKSISATTMFSGHPKLDEISLSKTPTAPMGLPSISKIAELLWPQNRYRSLKTLAIGRQEQSLMPKDNNKSLIRPFIILKLSTGLLSFLTMRTADKCSFSAARAFFHSKTFPISKTPIWSEYFKFSTAEITKRGEIEGRRYLLSSAIGLYISIRSCAPNPKALAITSPINE